MRRPLRFLLAAVALAAPVVLPAARAQTLTDVLVPRFIQGITGTNANRVPYAYRVTLGGLTPSATYRYTNQVVIATDAATSNGAGNVIFASPGGFTRSSSPSLSSVGNYGEFTTDGAGGYTGWFVTEPSSNLTRFVPGIEVFFRIALNNGAGGTTVVTRLTTTSSATVVNFGTAATDGTAFYSDAEATPRNFVVLYDNVAGTGRPVAATFAEDDGSPNTAANSYAAFYAASVDGVAGAWGVLIPNTLPNGIRRIEQRTAGGALAGAGTAGAATDADGVWPGADGIAGTADDVNTVNPAGGMASPLVLPSANAPLPVELSAFTAAADGQSAVLRWTTESETNNSGFAIETLRGASWTELAFVAGRGTTSERMSYERRIDGLGAGTHTFRLVQRDLAGTATVAGTVEVTVGMDGAFALDVRGNATAAPVLGIAAREAGTAVADVYDVLGQRVARYALTVEAGSRQNVALSGLSSGVYLVRVSGDGASAVTATARIVVAR